MERAAENGDALGEGIEFQHTAGRGGDVQIRPVEVKVAGHRVAREGPAVFPLDRSVGQEGTLEQAGSGATKVS